MRLPLLSLSACLVLPLPLRLIIPITRTPTPTSPLRQRLLLQLAFAFRQPFRVGGVGVNSGSQGSVARASSVMQEAEVEKELQALKAEEETVRLQEAALKARTEAQAVLEQDPADYRP